MLSLLKKMHLILIAGAIGLTLSHNSIAHEKSAKHEHERSEMYDEDSRLHKKNFHKYGYQHGSDRHYRHDRYHRGKSKYKNSEMYDEDSRLHKKNFHKYGYQDGSSRHDRYQRRKPSHYGHYGYENRQPRKYYTPYRGTPQSGVGIQIYKSLD